MKLICSVDVRKRSGGCSAGQVSNIPQTSFNIKNEEEFQTKKGKSVISIGYMSASSKEPQLSVCTKQDKRGSAFRV